MGVRLVISDRQWARIATAAFIVALSEWRG